MCERFHCLPSQLLAEDASFLQLMTIYARGTPQDLKGGYGDVE